MLASYGCELIGARAEAIGKAEDRELFKDAHDQIGLEMPAERLAHTLDEARACSTRSACRAVLRPSFTLGGTGGGIAYNREEFDRIVATGLDARPVAEVLIEE